MLSEKEFVDKIKQLPNTILSKTKKAAYSSFKLEGNILHFKRVNPKTDWDLNIIQLYRIYSTNKFINTSIIKQITKGRVNSPSVAVLMAIGCIDPDGTRI